MENIVSLAFEEGQRINFDDYSDKEYAIAKMGYISDRPNSHGLDISADVLKECASTVLGKWVVGKYNFAKTDLESHDPAEQILGIVPKEQEVEFVEEDGYTRAYVDVVISKIYAKEFCDILERDGSHAVSVEMKISSREGKGMNDIVDSFNIIGVTVLGTSVRPSIAKSDIEFVRFAEDAETYFDKRHLAAESKEKVTEKFSAIDNEEERKEGESKLAEIEFAAVNIGDLWGSLYNALRDKYMGFDYAIKDIYEENNQKFAVIHKYGESDLYRVDFTLTEEGLTLADEIVKVEIEVVETDEIRKFAEPENVEQYRTFAAKEEEKKDEAESEPEKKEEEDAKPEEEKAEMSADEMKAEMTRLQAEIDDRDNIIMDNKTKMEAMDAELAELRAFKKTCMDAEKLAKVDAIMASVAPYMDEKTATDCRNEGMACEFAEIDNWANAAKASVFDKVPEKKAKEQNEGFTRMSGVLQNNRDESGTALDRITKKFH